MRSRGCAEGGRRAACARQGGDGGRKQELDSATWAIGEGDGELDLPSVHRRELRQYNHSNDLFTVARSMEDVSQSSTGGEYR